MEFPTPEAGPDPLLGQLVHGYRIDQLLGAGGMGRVYRAHDTRLDRDVAIKLLLQSTPELLARFDREARAISAVNHPNVAQIFTVGQHGAWPYLVMEYLDGGSLAGFLEPGRRLQGARGVELMIQAASGLEAAWERGVVHRDVKPSNLMLQGSDRLKVVDFGLARRLGQDLSLTESDVALGTPNYIAPEQALGKPADFRADIYSLGATFYHLLSGFSPFTADTPVAMLLQHVQTPLTPLKDRNPRIPASLCRIIEHMLAKNPDERFASYQELLAALALARRGSADPSETAGGRATSPPRRVTAAAQPRGLGPTVLAAVLAGVAVAGIVLFALFGRGSTPDDPARSSDRALEAEVPTKRTELPRPEGAIAPETLAGLQRVSAGDTSPQALSALEGLPGPAAQMVQAALKAKTLAALRRASIAVEVHLAREMIGGETPPDLQTIARQEGLRPSELVDAWGHPLQLVFTGPEEYRLASLGADGVRGSADDLVIENGEMLGAGTPAAADRGWPPTGEPAVAPLVEPEPAPAGDDVTPEPTAEPTPPAPSAGR